MAAVIQIVPVNLSEGTERWHLELPSLLYKLAVRRSVNRHGYGEEGERYF